MSLCLSLSVPLSVCLSLSLSLSFYLSVSLCISVSVEFLQKEKCSFGHQETERERQTDRHSLFFSLSLSLSDPPSVCFSVSQPLAQFIVAQEVLSRDRSQFTSHRSTHTQEPTDGPTTEMCINTKGVNCDDTLYLRRCAAYNRSPEIGTHCDDNDVGGAAITLSECGALSIVLFVGVAAENPEAKGTPAREQSAYNAAEGELVATPASRRIIAYGQRRIVA